MGKDPQTGVLVCTNVGSDFVEQTSILGCTSGLAVIGGLFCFAASLISLVVYLVVETPDALVATKISFCLAVVLGVFALVFYGCHRWFLPDWTSCTRVLFRKSDQKKEGPLDDSASEGDSLT